MQEYLSVLVSALAHVRSRVARCERMLHVLQPVLVIFQRLPKSVGNSVQHTRGFPRA